jgi:hypothetical protein
MLQSDQFCRFLNTSVRRHVGAPALDVRLELRGHAVRGLVDDAPGLLVALRDRKRRGAGAARRCSCYDAARQCGGLAKKIPAAAGHVDLLC